MQSATGRKQQQHADAAAIRLPDAAADTPLKRAAGADTPAMASPYLSPHMAYATTTTGASSTPPASGAVRHSTTPPGASPSAAAAAATPVARNNRTPPSSSHAASTAAGHTTPAAAGAAAAASSHHASASSSPVAPARAFAPGSASASASAAASTPSPSASPSPPPTSAGKTPRKAMFGQQRRDPPMAAHPQKVGGVSMDQVKLLFGSIDVESLGYITRYQLEETLRDSGISFADARLEEVKRRLEEGERRPHPHTPAAKLYGARAEAAAAAAAHASPSVHAARASHTTTGGGGGSDPTHASDSSLPSSGAVASGERIDLARFAYIIAPNAALIDRIIKRQLVIPDWGSFTRILSDIFLEVREITAGRVADYIPELALASPSWFGVSFCSVDGQVCSMGDSRREFSVQSSSKPISYLMALDELGEEEVHRYVGREPSGRNFNDICLNPEQIPHNPMVNSGAIMVCSLVRHGLEQSARFRTIMETWAAVSGRQKYVTFSNSTYLSERATADRNFCLGYMMQEHDSFNLGSTRLRHLPGREWGANDLVKNLELYFQCCSIQTSAEGQAVIGATLASGGKCPLTDEQVFSGAHVRNCLSLMLSCGMYDYSGEWAYKIGLPAKSGVSGALMVVIPNVGGLSIYSPALDALGNTVRGIAFCKRLVEVCCFSSFSAHMQGKVNPASARNAAAQSDLIALCTLCARGDLTGIRAVLSAGADANGTDYDGRSPLHLAASEGQLAAVKYLCATSDLRLNPVDRWGNTPFSDAVREGHVHVAEYLFAKLKQQGITPSATPIIRNHNKTV